MTSTSVFLTLMLCGANSKDQPKHLDDYHEILNPRTVLDILDSMYIDEVWTIIESVKLFERSSNFTRVRNHLKAFLVACNCQRASAIWQMNHEIWSCRGEANILNIKFWPGISKITSTFQGGLVALCLNRLRCFLTSISFQTKNTRISYNNKKIKLRS